jgi:DNA repair protein SbcC/Rad50
VRIQQVRFKNLNSLSGEWAIDFTHAAFASDGIFAITGPTGAGKTTILDAICLALYGRTPRLSKITRSANEVMSRQTGECFAEVTFETAAGRFRCHWSQHRARKRADGELQAPKHEIADADSGKIVETKLRGVAEQIESATGMDYNRFTRSMLLAQGGFAVFLQAAADERAPILEQITGTEIYSRISMQVHARRSDEGRKRDALRAELAGMQLLDEAHEQQLKSDLALKLAHETQLDGQVKSKTQALAWLDGIARLEGELKQVEEQQRDWLKRYEAFAPENEKLQRAMQAMDLAGEHAALTACRGQQALETRNRCESFNALGARQAAVKQAERAQLQAAEDLQISKAALKEAQPLIRKARELDLKLREKNEPIRTVAEAIEQHVETLDALRHRHDQECRALERQKRDLEQVAGRLASAGGDEALVEHLAGIRARFETLKHQYARMCEQEGQVKAAGQQLLKAQKVCRQKAADSQACKLSMDAARTAVDQKQLELQNVLGAYPLSEWRERLSSFKETRALHDSVDQALQTVTTSKRLLAQLGLAHERASAERTRIGDQLQAQIDTRAGLEREAELLDTQLSLIQRIQDFEDARAQLQDGTPCPLCGAEAHPFAAGNIPVPDQTRGALNKVRRNLKAAGAAVADLKVKQAELIKDLEQITYRKKECDDKIADARVRMALIRKDARLDAAGPDLEAHLPRLQKDNLDRLTRATQTVAAAETLERAIGTLRETLESKSAAAAQAERHARDAAHDLDMAGQLLARGQRDAAELDSQLRSALAAVRQEVGTYGIEELSMEVLDSVGRQLCARRDQWVAWQKQRSALEQAVSILAVQTGDQERQMRQSEGELKKQRDRLGLLHAERDALLQQRRITFEDKNPDDAERRLMATIERCETVQAAAGQALNTANQALGNLLGSIEVLDRSLAARAVELQSAEAAFASRLERLGFLNEAQYAAACLPETEREHLKRQAQQLSDEKSGLSAGRHDKTTQLAAQRQKRLTDQSRAELEQALNSLVAGHKEIQLEIGGISRKLKDNEALRQKQQERVRAIEAQEGEYARWDMLHALIGSADGKKFRNFAQGLTFEMMIGHANRQLKKMSDRYLLIRDEAQSLELNVIDSYQAGEIRSTKNLSGGESFIVSLSLALGLSHMASRNVRVDSLFLDEGFGTLDEEALDTALETLSGLQRDGKLIGVISHVPALRERIGTQIEVIPENGGKSVIRGPGCGPSAFTAAPL